VQVVIGARRDFLERAPALHNFLKNYRTSSAIVSESLAYMQQRSTCRTTSCGPLAGGASRACCRPSPRS
jgi:ABC-type proline/glycine betaine transport system substrate-binding protein